MKLLNRVSCEIIVDSILCLWAFTNFINFCVSVDTERRITAGGNFLSLSLKVVSDINKIYLYFVLSVYKLYYVNDCKWCLSRIVNCFSVAQLNVWKEPLCLNPLVK